MKRRMSSYPLLYIGLIVSMLGTGCTALSNTLSPASAHWQLTGFALHPDGQPLSPLPHVFSLHLDEEGRAHGQVACNRWHGSYRLSGRALRFSGLGSTKARCLFDDATVARLEREYLTRLAQGADVEVEYARLTMRFADGVLWHFERRPE